MVFSVDPAYMSPQWKKLILYIMKLTDCTETTYFQRFVTAWSNVLVRLWMNLKALLLLCFIGLFSIQ